MFLQVEVLGVRDGAAVRGADAADTQRRVLCPRAGRRVRALPAPAAARQCVQELLALRQYWVRL